jgi:DnaJ-class molecular chaperone
MIYSTGHTDTRIVGCPCCMGRGYTTTPSYAPGVPPHNYPCMACYGRGYVVTYS